MGDSTGTSHGGIWRKASLKVVMFEMRSEGRGRPAERREGFQTEERDERRPRGGREEPEDTRKWQSDRESEAKRQRDARKSDHGRWRRNVWAWLHCCPFWGVGTLGRWPPGWGRKLVSRTEGF